MWFLYLIPSSWLLPLHRAYSRRSDRCCWWHCHCPNTTCRSWALWPTEHTRRHCQSKLGHRPMHSVKAGILNCRYCRKQLDLCPQRLVTLDVVERENQVSLRTAVIAQSTAGRQAFIECIIVAEQGSVRQIVVNASRQNWSVTPDAMPVCVSELCKLLL